MTPSDVGMVVQPFVTGSYSIQANKQPGRQTDRHTRTDTDRQPDRPDTDRQTNRHTHTLTDRQPERQTGLHTDRQPDRQMSRQTNTSIQRNAQMDKQTDHLNTKTTKPTFGDLNDEVCQPADTQSKNEV